MAGIRWNFTPLLLSLLLLSSLLSSLLLSPSCALQMDRVRVSSVSTYGVELVGVGGPVRTRRTGTSTSTSTSGLSHHMKLSGVNVCGGQCCIGWSQAPGSQRCTKRKMGKRKDLSDFDEGQIVMSRRLGQSVSKAAGLVGCSQYAVVRTYQKWSKEGQPVN
ncbi:hypothetical protein PGIGA_G00012650 [Pangasianodon gigas]|uniref:Uncharacterized protein n=1 Tax=Pangasianodon gigas TaxID=30993 RepID=A0ACC5WTM7_PANGG|nr:hypothetical protein [Pangasianodon gigas]